MPTPTPLPYTWATPVADLLNTVADPSTGAPSLFTTELGALVALILSLMWAAYFLHHFGVIGRR